ncbi:nucleotide exchange factor SIL1-like, partial [Trifolium medium]|nr:nucleotide exchange factor SIL1-like [Trifolium medium]
MDRTLLLAALILCTAATATAAIAETDKNLTSHQPSWSTAAEESDLLPPDSSVSDSDGGFSSMDSMLHWAI